MMTTAGLRELAGTTLLIAASCAVAPPAHRDGVLPGPARQATGSTVATSRVTAATMPQADARRILTALHARLPPALRATLPVHRGFVWREWVSRHRDEVRERLDRGDEDSLVNFWHYGTSFTGLPPLSVRNIVALGDDVARIERIARGRLDDLIAGIGGPGTNERLRLARAFVARKVPVPAGGGADHDVRAYLLDARRRIFAERNRRRGALQSAGSEFVRLAGSHTYFSDRGLSSDTSILPGFTIEAALAELSAGETPRLDRVRRVAVVGPGLDFTDKVDGYDFYPLQTIQPFAVIDSLIRTGLSTADDLQLTTFDVSPRINRHLDTARARARAGAAYVLQLPLDRNQRWNPAFVEYWRRVGDRIGRAVTAPAPPVPAGDVSVRAVRVRPDIVTAITGQELDVVLERLPPVPVDERFDLIIATNVLVYYDLFAQNLALANIAAMLRPGGVLLSNTRVVPAVAMTLMDECFKVSHTETRHDCLFWYLP